MRERILGNGMAVTVDDEDADLLDQYGWYALQDGNHWYACAQVTKPDGRKTSVKMHRLIAARVAGDEAIVGKRVDHIDQHGLNNQRENLRLASQGENLVNTGKRKKVGGTTSRYKGVYLHQGPGGRVPRYRAMVRVGERRISLGYFDTEEEAALAFDRAAIERHGDFEQLNFSWKHCTGNVCGGELQPEQQFPRRNNRASGRASRCKTCTAAESRRRKGVVLTVICVCGEEICHLCCHNGACEHCGREVSEAALETVALQMATDLDVSVTNVRASQFLPKRAWLDRS